MSDVPVAVPTAAWIGRSVLLFVLAGLCEIGGGYLVWLWLRESRSVWLGALGGLVVFLYAVIPTLQTGVDFGRVYAAYGGVFVVLSLLWWLVGRRAPSRRALRGRRRDLPRRGRGHHVLAAQRLTGRRHWRRLDEELARLPRAG